MTPTLKLKRNNLMTHFALEIDSMYEPDRGQAKVRA